MEIDDLKRRLSEAYIPVDREEPDPEAVYSNNILAGVRESIENGIIDPEMLTEEMFRNLISGDMAIQEYNEAVKKQLEDKGINAEEYFANREQIIKEKTEENKRRRVELWKNRKKTGKDDFENGDSDEYDDYEYDDNSDEYDAYTPTDKKFFKECTEIAMEPANNSIKTKWINKMKTLMEKAVKAIKDTFQR